jgi:hypothetical protein
VSVKTQMDGYLAEKATLEVRIREIEESGVKFVNEEAEKRIGEIKAAMEEFERESNAKHEAEIEKYKQEIENINVKNKEVIDLYQAEFNEQNDKLTRVMTTKRRGREREVLFI